MARFRGQPGRQVWARSLKNTKYSNNRKYVWQGWAGSRGGKYGLGVKKEEKKAIIEGTSGKVGRAAGEADMGAELNKCKIKP